MARANPILPSWLRRHPKLALSAVAGLGCLVIFGFVTLLSPSASGTQERIFTPQSTSSASSNALPRFVSLRADRVNVRRGPGQDHDVVWIYNKAGLPVEVIAEFETWRRIRDSEGAEGWVFQGLLSSRRTALVKPWARDEMVALRRDGREAADVVAWLQPGVLMDVERCNGQWCLAHSGNVSGWVVQDELWGIYPNEAARF